MTRRPWKDSLGVTHLLPADLLMKGGPAAFTAPPASEGAFRALVDELIEFQERRRRMAAKVKIPTNTRDPKAEREAERVSRTDHIRPRPAATRSVRKSFAAMTAELNEMVNATRAQTAEIQRQTAIEMFTDLNAAARAGRLDALSAAKVDALAHRNARALGLERVGVRS